MKSINSLRRLIDLESSPVFLLSQVSGVEDTSGRAFSGQVTAFHVGEGIIVSVAHPLRAEMQLPRHLTRSELEKITSGLDKDEDQQFIEGAYAAASTGDRRILSVKSAEEAKRVVELISASSWDNRFETLIEKELLTPHVIVEQRVPVLYGDDEATKGLPSYSLHEEAKNGVVAFLLPLELRGVDHTKDVAVYRLSGWAADLADLLPSVKIAFREFGMDETNLYCVQSSPSGTNWGKLINTARIDGLLEHHAVYPNRHGEPYIGRGLRYLISGYFRFGSSGAPYVFLDAESGEVRVNALQSEACPVQLAIKGDREGNFQYVNALATPLSEAEEVVGSA